jgi:hypothetical protein
VGGEGTLGVLVQDYIHWSKLMESKRVSLLHTSKVFFEKPDL